MADDRPTAVGLSLVDRVGAFGLGLMVGLCLVALDHRRPMAPQTALIPLSAKRAERGIGALLKRTWIGFTTDRIPAVAAGATFFSLLAAFPAMGVFAALYGLFADLGKARRDLLQLRGILPDGAIAVLGDQLKHLAETPHTGLGLAFIMSLVLSLWSANAGMKSLIAGLNVAYEERERRNFIQLNLVSLGMTIGGILMVVALAVLPGWLTGGDWARSPQAAVFRWALLLASVIVGLSVLYRYGPSRSHVRWRWITPGSGVAALAWLVMSALFTLYVAHFGAYDRTYGALGAVVGFMTWMWLSLSVVLLGAELDSELEQDQASR